jgi:hypothetical protein
LTVGVVVRTTLTPEQLALRGRVGAYALHSMGGTSTRAATKAQLARFDQQVLDAAAARGQTLTPEEFAARVRSARKAYFGRLALKSSLARSNRKAAPTDENVGTATEVRRASDERPPAA